MTMVVNKARDEKNSGAPAALNVKEKEVVSRWKELKTMFLKSNSRYERKQIAGELEWIESTANCALKAALDNLEDSGIRPVQYRPPDFPSTVYSTLSDFLRVIGFYDLSQEEKYCFDEWRKLVSKRDLFIEAGFETPIPSYTAKMVREVLALSTDSEINPANCIVAYSTCQTKAFELYSGASDGLKTVIEEYYNCLFVQSYDTCAFDAWRATYESLQYEGAVITNEKAVDAPVDTNYPKDYPGAVILINRWKKHAAEFLRCCGAQARE